MKTKHCKNVGIKVDGKYLCKYPGMECVKSFCKGYDECKDYEEGNREITDTVIK